MEYTRGGPIICSGPCVVCGMTNYPLSMGGRHICPACDCGIEPTDPRHPLMRMKMIIERPFKQRTFSGKPVTDQEYELALRERITVLEEFVRYVALRENGSNYQSLRERAQKILAAAIPL